MRASFDFRCGWWAIVSAVALAWVAAGPIRGQPPPGSFRAVSRGSTWKYFRGFEEASSPDPAAWRGGGFNDASWASGNAPFGYGDGPFGTDVSLLNPPMQNNYSTLFLRQSFELADPRAVQQLVASVDYDDGFVIWINSTEVLRVNFGGLPGDPVPFDGFSPSGHESGAYEDFFLPDPAGYFVSGTNVVAVQVFNVTLTSSDLKFDLDLFDPVAPDVTPPEVALLVPAAGTTVRSLGQVQVTFTEDVTGVNAADVLINGMAAASVTGAGRGPYTFSFPEPPTGRVDVSWALAHGITDLADAPNAFGGGSWTYTLDPTAAAGNLVINEILAVNRTGVRDEDGETSDWIEIRNPGPGTVNPAGWSLTDDPDEPRKWTFPGRSLGPRQYLVVFASGKDRRPASGNLHANFKLGSTGEYLGLYNGESPREVVSELAPRFPRQRADFSYGVDGTGALVYFQRPTPGAGNSSSLRFEGFVLDPVFTPGRSFFDAPFFLAISSVTPGADIRVTLDGSEPTPGRGTLYAGPFEVAGTARKGVVTVRAIAFKSGLLPSEVITHSYIFPENVMTQPGDPGGFPSNWNGQAADYAMDRRVVNDPRHTQLVRDGLTSIPTLSVVGHVNDFFNGSRGILANPSREGLAWERPCSAELIYPDGRRGFQLNCGIRVQGGSSTRGWKAIKVSMRLLFKGDYGPTKLRFRLFPDSEVERFDTIVLDAHLNQTWNHPSHGQRVRAQYCRDQFVSDLQNAMGGLAPHDVFAHLYVNGLYWGVYDLHERPDHSFAAEYFGGDKARYDCLRHNSSTVVNGSSSVWNAMISRARRDLSSNSNFLALLQYIDVSDLIDYMLANIYAGNDDWAHHNWYVTRFRAPGAGFRIHSWDAEHVLKSATIDRTGVNNAGSPTEVYSRLQANAEFRLLFADHVHRHFFNGGVLYVDPRNRAWNPDRPDRNVPASLYMRRIEEVDPAIACESARWGDAKRPNQPYTRNNEWVGELNWLLTRYFPVRSGNVLGQLRARGLYPRVGAPVFSKHGGRIEPGFMLTMTRPAGTSGTMFFTTDGSDPRVFGSGTVSDSATAYSGALVLNDHTHLKARILSGSTWSAVNEATFTLTDPLEVLRITEVMYNPLGGSSFEFIELQNTGGSTVDLSGLRFTNGIDFAFPADATLGPGEFLVLVANPDAFRSRHPAVEVGGVYGRALANGGEKVTLKNAGGVTIVSVDYDDEGFWPVGADGFGYSLVILDVDGDPDDPENWRASTDVGGSPGTDDPAPLHGGVVINEVLAASVPPLEDAIELFNRTASTLDIGGWYLSDSRTNAISLAKFRIPDGTLIPAGGYAVFYENQFSSNPFAPLSFSLEDAGGAVYLSSAGAAGNLTGHIVEAAYGAEESGVPFGRLATSTGVDFGAVRERSFGVDLPRSVEEFRTGTGRANGLPRFGPVVINEIMYNPVLGREEFVELYNPTGAPVSLHVDAIAGSWRLTGVQGASSAAGFEFGPGVEIPAQGYLLAVGIDPEVFRGLHAVPASVPIVGPYGGRLDNGGERLRLIRPDASSGEVLNVVVDQVRFNDKDPWPTSTDGGGPSLERIVASSYGNDPVNWDASTQNGGTPGAANSVSTFPGNRLPQAVFSATPSSGEAPLEVLLDASRSYDLDGEILSFTWNFGDGSADNGRVVTHTFTNPGVYVVTLRVEDGAGATGSAAQIISVEEDRGGGQVPGDSNQDGLVSISDAISLLRHLFVSRAFLPCGGDSIQGGGNKAVLDVNGDGGVDIADVVYILSFLFTRGPGPVLGTDCLPVPGCPDACGV